MMDTEMLRQHKKNSLWSVNYRVFMLTVSMVSKSEAFNGINRTVAENSWSLCPLMLSDVDFMLTGLLRSAAMPVAYGGLLRPSLPMVP